MTESSPMNRSFGIDVGGSGVRAASWIWTPAS